MPALADRVRARELIAKELSAQAAEALERLDPVIEAVLGIYEDAVADPDKDGPSKTGQLYGVPRPIEPRLIAHRGRDNNIGRRPDTLRAGPSCIRCPRFRRGVLGASASSTSAFEATKWGKVHGYQASRIITVAQSATNLPAITVSPSRLRSDCWRCR